MIIPKRKRRGRPRKDSRQFLNIAATVDYRGDNDDILFFMFRDPPASLLEYAFSRLVCKGEGIARSVVITEEHDIVKRVGYGYWRKAVEVKEPNYHFSDLETMKLLISAVLQRIYPCSVEWLTIDKFLNI